MEGSHVIELDNDEPRDDNLTSEVVGPKAIIPFVGTHPSPLPI